MTDITTETVTTEQIDALEDQPCAEFDAAYGSDRSAISEQIERCETAAGRWGGSRPWPSAEREAREWCAAEIARRAGVAP